MATKEKIVAAVDIGTTKIVSLVGKLNEGWTYAMMALNLERFDIGSIADVRRLLDELIFPYPEMDKEEKENFFIFYHHI